MKLDHIPLVGGLDLDSLPSLSILPSDVCAMAVAQRGEELRHVFAPEGEVEPPAVGAEELDIGDVVRPRCLPHRLERTEPVGSAGVLVGDFCHPSPSPLLCCAVPPPVGGLES
jgi:hypothetical protein